MVTARTAFAGLVDTRTRGMYGPREVTILRGAEVAETAADE
jgi:hypothetical protein